MKRNLRKIIEKGIVLNIEKPMSFVKNKAIENLFINFNKKTAFSEFDFILKGLYVIFDYGNYTKSELVHVYKGYSKF